jgi:hypothetical protein
VNQDCISGFCDNEICTDHCSSGTADGDESDKDCGGSCETKCGDNKRCVESSDCESLLCVNNRCQAPSCNDKVLNQDESDKDCGGACALADKACGISARCNSGADCESWVCSKSKCVADIDVAQADFIDNFEDNDFLLPALGGRAGTWYKYGDSTGTATEETSLINRGASKHGILTTGTGFTGWGSGLGVDLDNEGGRQEDKVPYNASEYTGVTFWARADAPLSVAFVLPDGDTDAAGMNCEICDHHWFKSVEVGLEWERHTVLFSELSLEPGGDPAPEAFDPKTLVAIQFRMLSGLTYKLWIDDVAFVK